MAYSAPGITKAFFLGIIFVVSFAGNVLVAYILIKHRLLLLSQRPTYQFILNIIISDLVVGVLTIPFEFVRELLDSWIFGSALCKIVDFIEIAVTGSAVFTHALIAVDRYRSLAHPHLPRIKEKLVKQLIALSWITPATISCPYLYMFHVLEVDTKLICTPTAIPMRWLDKLYEAVEFAVVLLIPFCVLCWCYSHVTLIMWGRSPRISTVSFSTTQSVIVRSRKSVTRTACLVAGAFIVCLLPAGILSVARIVSGTEVVYRGHFLYEISMFGAYINEMLNPIIYCTFDRNIKTRMASSFRCLSQRDDGILTERTCQTTEGQQKSVLSKTPGQRLSICEFTTRKKASNVDIVTIQAESLLEETAPCSSK